jgi:hypothetical protein
MSDNVNIIVQDTINEIVVNTAVVVETIDINVQTPIDEVTIISNPNEYIININRVIGEQVQSDWNQTDNQEPDYIKNKPIIPTQTSDLSNDGSDGVHPFITAQDITAQVNSDWNATSGVAEILNKPIIPSISGLATTIYVDQQDALKVDKVAGYGLSQNDFTNTLKTKLDGIEAGAQVNINADWNATIGDAEILNKPTIPSITNLVPYTGANSDVVLGFQSLYTGSRNDVILSPTGLEVYDDGSGPTQGVIVDYQQIRLFQSVGNNVVLSSYGILFNDNSFQNTAFPPTGGISSQYIKGDGTLATFPTIPTQTSQLTNNGSNGINPFITALDIPTLASADKMVTIGRNSTGSTLYRGTIVYISGSTGNRPNFVKSIANSEAGSAGTFGVIQNDIPNNSDGNCVTIGAIDNLDTRSTATHPFTSDTLADGDTIYLSPTTAGYITNVKPSAPNHLVYIGKVVRTSPTNGTIVYRIQNGYELNEIHDVAISSVVNNQLLSYDSATSLWKNKSVTTADISDSTNKRYQTDNQNTYNDATSSIQTQLNAKQNSLSFTPYKYINTTSSSVTGTTTETIMATATISGNSFNANDIMKILYEVNKTTILVAPTLRIRINTTNTLSGSTTIGTYTMPAANTFALMQRNFVLSSGNLLGYSFATTALTDITTAVLSSTTTAYNTANTLYLFFTIQLANTGDLAFFTMGNITN